MSYTRDDIEEKLIKYRSVPRRLTSKLAVWIVRALIVIAVTAGISGGYAAYGTMRGILDKSPSVDSIRVAPSGFQTTIYNAKGKKIRTVVGAGANRIYKTLDKIPVHVQKAFVAIEDERFYEHGGIDVKGMFRAGFVAVLSGGKKKQGASTITQQLLKNQVFSGGEEETYLALIERKLQEQYLAIQVESLYSKDQILEYYLNTINLGQNTLGVQTASLRYFNKDVSKLTVSEAAVLAGITKNPTENNPITHPETNEARRKEILNSMLRLGFITEAEVEEARADDVYERIKAVNTEIGVADTTVNSYYVDATISQVVDDLCEKKGYTVAGAYNLIYSGGLSIYTYQDPVIQKICNKTVANKDFYARVPEKLKLNYALSVQDKEGNTVNYSEGHIQRHFKLDNILFKEEKDAAPYIERFKEEKVKEGDTVIGEKIFFTIQPQVSVCVIDHKKGAVSAIVGGRGKKTGNLTLNRATGTTRQPGSLFKVLSTYLPAIDTAGYTLASVQDDGLFYYPYTNKEVNNWWGRRREGLSSYRRGIYRSMNIVTVKALAAMGIQPALAYLGALGFTTITEEDNNLALSLGGLSKGVSNLEVTAAYGTIANNGIYVKPSFYSKVVDHEGNVILKNERESRQVMKDSTAFLLTDAMHDTLTRSDATAGWGRLRDVNMGQAAKTGSSQYYNDIWISGYTPYYTTTIWCGFDNNFDQTGFSNYHVPIWKAIMDGINEKKKLKSKAFVQPESVTTANICSKCGKLAVPGLCDRAKGGSTVRREFFAVGTVPTESCDVHVKLKVCKKSKKVASEFCPPSDVEEIVYLIKNESITQNDAKGKEVVRNYTTDDTPNIIPKDIRNSVCNVHYEGYNPLIEDNQDDGVVNIDAENVSEYE